jgi:type IV pilus assembly protein PilA
MILGITSSAKRAASRENARGFSLIELLIVVAIILIIAAIAIPNLIRSRMAANEASAVSSVRTITTSDVTYASVCPTIGYAATLVDLGPGAGGCAGGANIMDGILSQPAPTKSGYSFVYIPIPASGMNSTYTINASPTNPGLSGQRYFYSDQTGVIRYGLNGAATASSSPIT